MKPVFMTKGGGPDAPLEEQGDCLQACLASVLEIPLEQAFDIIPYGDGNWGPPLDEWLRQFGLHLVIMAWDADWEYPGITLLGGIHQPTGIKHVVVCRDGNIVHDPTGLPAPLTPETVWFFAALDPALPAGLPR